MAAQTTITVTPASYTSLGAGPLLVEGLNGIAKIAISTAQPAAGSSAFLIQAGTPTEVNATDTIWASAAGGPATLSYGPITTGGGGGSGGTSSNFNSAFPTPGTAVGFSDGTNMKPGLVDGPGNLKVNVVAGGASGGTSSSFSAAFPATGTAIGLKNGANMVNATADASGNANVNLQTAIPTGSNVIGGVTQSGAWTVADSSVVSAIQTATGDGTSFTPASVTSAATIFSQDMSNYEGISVQVTSAGTTCTITYETSDDNSTWSSCSGMSGNAAVGSNPITTTTTATLTAFQKKGKYFRARVSTYTSGTVTVVYTLHRSAVALAMGQPQLTGAAASGSAVSGNPLRVGYQARTSNLSVTNGQTVDGVATLAGAHVMMPYSIPELTWSHAAVSGGIVNSTTAETLQAAAASGIRNYLVKLALDFTGTVATASELVVRDGAGGTILWRGAQEAAVGHREATFNPPLKGTSATLMEFATLTGMGASSAVYVNAQGYQTP